MALIPGTLPSDTCYGTPQDLLELFAQYLDVPAFALNSKVVFSTSSAGLTADVVWFDTTTATNPILKITVGGGFTDYVNNYLVNLATETAATGDFVLVQDISDSNKSKKVTAQTIANLAVVTPAAGSITYPMLSTSATQANNVASRTAKAWVNFNGAFASSPFTIANGGIRSSFNVSSVTDNSTGEYTINLVSGALADANYVCVFGVDTDTATSGDGTTFGLVTGGTKTTTALQVCNKNLNAPFTAGDRAQQNVVIFG